MPSVVVVSPEGDEVTVTDARIYIQLVYGDGYHPKVGGWEENLRVLRAGGPPPTFEDLTPILLTDLDDPTSEATKRLRANVEGVVIHDGTTGGGTRPTGYVRIRWINPAGSTYGRPTSMVAGDVWEHDA